MLIVVFMSYQSKLVTNDSHFCTQAKWLNAKSFPLPKYHNIGILNSELEYLEFLIEQIPSISFGLNMTILKYAILKYP